MIVRFVVSLENWIFAIFEIKYDDTQLWKRDNGDRGARRGRMVTQRKKNGTGG